MVSFDYKLRGYLIEFFMKLRFENLMLKKVVSTLQTYFSVCFIFYFLYFVFCMFFLINFTYIHIVSYFQEHIIHHCLALPYKFLIHILMYVSKFILIPSDVLIILVSLYLVCFCILKSYQFNLYFNFFFFSFRISNLSLFP